MEAPPLRLLNAFLMRPDKNCVYFPHFQVRVILSPPRSLPLHEKTPRLRNNEEVPPRSRAKFGPLQKSSREKECRSYPCDVRHVEGQENVNQFLTVHGKGMFIARVPISHIAP